MQIQAVIDYVSRDWQLGRVHGIEHWRRVERNGLLLATEDVNTKVVRLFAYFHDHKRMDDGWDLSHGQRAAENLDNLRTTLLSDLTEEELAEADLVSSLPITSLKLHQLQILHGTRMAMEWKENRSDFIDFTLESYTDLVVDFVRRLRSNILIERYVSSAPKDLLIAPRFGVKQAVVEARIKDMLKRDA